MSFNALFQPVVSSGSFLINIFKSKISSSFILDSVSVRAPTGIIGGCSGFMVNYNFKVSQSPGCVSVASAICKDIYILNRDFILLTDVYIHI